jgi:imidazolonepropionase-like amidohydrolase
MLRAVSALSVSFGLLLMAVLFNGETNRARADQTSVPQETLRSHPPGVFALTGAKVVVNPEITLDSATIIVRNGKIEAVGDVKVPADAKEISLAGKTIYPGFIDAYAEQTVSSDRLAGTARYWNGQVTSQLSIADQLVASEDLSSLRKQGFVAQLVAPAEGVVRGTSALVATSGGEVNSTLLKRDVAQHLLLTLAGRRRGAGFPGSPMGAVALARQVMYDAQWYRDAHAAVTADPALPLPEKNDALAALQPVINGSMPVIVSTSNEQFVLRADRFASEFGLNVIMKGSGSEYRRLEEIAATKRTIILPLVFPKAPNVATPESADDATLESLLHWDIAPENPARVDAAGIRFALSTDRLESKSDFLKSLRKAVERGLSKTSALRALTVTPAELFGVTDQLGSIQSGRLASFVVTDGDLFDKKTKIVETWVSGSRFEHDPAKARKADGSYQLQVQQIGQFPGVLYLEVSEDQGKLRGRISRQPISKEEKKPTGRGGRGRSGASEQAKDDKAGDAKPEEEKAGDAKPEESKPDESKPEAEKPATDGEGHASSETRKDEGSDKTGDSDKADATKQSKEPEKKEVLDLQGLKINDTYLSASFNGKDWGFEGVARLSLTMTETDITVKDRAAGIGSIVWPDGSTAITTATRIDPPADKSEDKPADEGDKKSDEPKPDDAKSDDSKSEEKSTDSKGGEKADDDKKSKPASFEVNYPLGAFGRKEIPAAAKLTAFVHATIWTCGPAGIIEDGTLVVADGKIVDVGKDIKIPDGAEVIDIRGTHITPGIIDCHSHAATDGGVNEGTSSITCEVRIGDFVDANDVTIYRQLAGGVTAANVLHGSANAIGGQNQVIKLRWGVSGEGIKFKEAPQGVKFALGENVKQSNWGSDATGRYPQTRMGVEQLYRDAFEAARDYARKMDAWKANRRGLPPRRDLELDALREILDGERWIHCHSYRQDEILALLRILKEYEITIGTFQHILEGYKVADEMAKAGAMASAFSDWWAYKMEVQDAIPYAGALMHKQGVVVSFNSDDGELARHLNQEAAKAVKYGGVDRQEALKFVTLNPARQLRIDHLVGSIESGKHADFVVWSGDPLSNFSRCEQTWIDGRRYFHRDDDDRMQKESREKRNVLIQKVLESGEDMREPGERDFNPSELWPRVDEYCTHFSHMRAQQNAEKSAQQGAQQGTQQGAQQNQE